MATLCTRLLAPYLVDILLLAVDVPVHPVSGERDLVGSDVGRRVKATLCRDAGDKARGQKVDLDELVEVIA